MGMWCMVTAAEGGGGHLRSLSGKAQLLLRDFGFKLCKGADREETASYAVNAPLWGNMYRMDLEAMADFRVPSLLFGPIGKDAHQMSELRQGSAGRGSSNFSAFFIEQTFANT